MRILPSTASFTLCTAAVFLVLSCGKDDPAEPVATTGGGSSVEHVIPVGDALTLDVAGQVVDEAGQPVAGATVSAGFNDRNTQTDARGAFLLRGVAGYTRLAYVKAVKPGYFEGSRSFVPTEGTDQVRIALLARTPAGTVQGADGGAVTAEGVTLSFQAGSFVADGTPYTGPVQVVMGHIDPTGAGLADEMPGALLGALEADQPRWLTSFGMVAVDLIGNAGQRVELAEGSTAELRFPVMAGQQGVAPAVIDLWHFDATRGYWMKEGTAERIGAEYVAQVAHFSFWNVDVPGAFVHLSGRITDPLSNGLSGARVHLTSSTLGSSASLTGATGNFGGYVPAGEVLTLSVAITCGGIEQVVHTASAGPFSTDTELPAIAVSGAMTIVSGTVVDCDGAPVAAGYVWTGQGMHALVNGTFSYATCTGPATLVAYDLGAGRNSPVLTFTATGTAFNAGLVEACNATVPGIPGDGAVDLDGNNYPSVLIGTQEWMAANLRTTRYANGDALPNTTGSWLGLSTGAWVNYENDPANDAAYGKLYNWAAAADPRNVCPNGWHVPSDADWKQLELALGMDGTEVEQTNAWRGDVANIGGRLKNVSPLWEAPNTGATNATGFSGLPGGFRQPGGYTYMGFYGAWWTSTPDVVGATAWIRQLGYVQPGIQRASNINAAGNCIRCLKD